MHKNTVSHLEKKPLMMLLVLYKKYKELCKIL